MIKIKVYKYNFILIIIAIKPKHMCGIFALLNNTHVTDTHMKFIEAQFQKGRGRGPENSKISQVYQQTIFGFHRLAINGLNSISNQPITVGNVTLICNGEIYNYKELYQLMECTISPTTESDCEVIIHLYNKYGMNQTLQMLDGVFAFVLLDADLQKDTSVLYVARDPYGVRPLYVLHDERLIGFASELKMLSSLAVHDHTINQFSPGSYSKYTCAYKVLSNWEPKKTNVIYHTLGTMRNNTNNIMENIRHYFTNAVKKRCLVTERPIACLLSGGLDSSLVVALANEYYGNVLETYSIGMEGSVDLKHARIVADYLGTKHTEIVLTEQMCIDIIPEVIYAIESYDTTTVRASIGNYLLGKYIATNSSAKVILNGDGSDELCGGYLYMHKCPDAIEFDKESRRLLKHIHAFDVLRSDKCISSHGLEPRTPFLDRSWVQYYMSIEPSIRHHSGQNQCEKFLLRNAFSKENFLNSNGLPLLPDEILWRRKEAFSDGVTKNERSLYEIIQENVGNEKEYYRKVFDEHYKGHETVVPYLWMPRYVEATDASARTLSIYYTDQKEK